MTTDLLRALDAPFKYIRRSRSCYRQCEILRRDQFAVTFPHEGVVLQMPDYGIADIFHVRERPYVLRASQFVKRPDSERLLRKLVADFLQHGVLDRRKSIVDIGAWISDNALVWAKLLDADHGRVFAIDPSNDNIRFGQRIAAANGIQNIDWFEAVCSDVDQQNLSFSGDLSHTAFDVETSPSGPTLKATTLDRLIPDEFHTEVDLLHVDVEGFEYKVLKGAMDLIGQSAPIIIFEQHINSESTEPIFDLLKDQPYRFFTINEMMRKNAVDCRNMMAIPDRMDMNAIDRVVWEIDRSLVYDRAVLGPPLIRIERQA